MSSTGLPAPAAQRDPAIGPSWSGEELMRLRALSRQSFFHAAHALGQLAKEGDEAAARSLLAALPGTVAEDWLDESPKAKWSLSHSYGPALVRFQPLLGRAVLKHLDSLGPSTNYYKPADAVRASLCAYVAQAADAPASEVVSLLEAASVSGRALAWTVTRTGGNEYQALMTYAFRGNQGEGARTLLGSNPKVEDMWSYVREATHYDARAAISAVLGALRPRVEPTDYTRELSLIAADLLPLGQPKLLAFEALWEGGLRDAFTSASARGKAPTGDIERLAMLMLGSTHSMVEKARPVARRLDESKVPCLLMYCDYPLSFNPAGLVEALGPELVERSLSNPERAKALVMACAKNSNVPALMELGKLGVDVQCKNERGWTANSFLRAEQREEWGAFLAALRARDSIARALAMSPSP